MQRIGRTVSAVFFGSTSMLAGSEAFAQTPTSGPANGTAANVDIIVTAQRREERLQDVPISISAIGGDQLASRNMQGIDRLDSYVPNLRVYHGTYSASSTIAIRGAAEINPGPYFDPTVGTYVDGVYVGKALGNLFNLADLERVEVLRGPQGTLYGRNTFAGAINLISAKPTGEWGGNIKLGTGNYEALRGRFNLNLPRVGDFMVKLSGSIDRQDGYTKVVHNPFRNVANARPKQISRLEYTNNKAARVAVRYEPESAIVLDYVFDYGGSDATPADTRLNNVAMAPLPGAIFDPASPAYAGGLVNGTYLGFPADLYVQPGYTNFTYANGSVNNAPAEERVRTYGHALTGSIDLGEATLKSITAIRKMHFNNFFDLDGTPLPLAAGSLDNHFRQFSQELQITGETGIITYTAGLFYYKERGKVVNQQQFFGNATTSDLRYKFGGDAYAAYAQVDVKLAEALTLTGGLRYSRESKTMNAALASITEATGVAAPIFDPTRRKATADAWTPTAIVKYDFSHDANIYLKYARGFKSGGFNLGTNAAFAVTAYEPEFVDSFEAGTKLRLAGGLAQINAAVFLNKIKDLQVSVFRNDGIFTASVVDNAAKADVFGAELEMQLRPIEWLQLSGSLGYLDSKYKDYIDAGVDVSKTRAITFAPEISVTASADLRMAKGDWGEVHLLVDYSHVDEHFVQALDVRPRSATVRTSAQTTKAAAMDLLDLTLRINNVETSFGSVEFSIWGKNIFDTHKRIGGVDFGPNFGNLTTAYYNVPRTWGVDLTLRF